MSTRLHKFSLGLTSLALFSMAAIGCSHKNDNANERSEVSVTDEANSRPMPPPSPPEPRIAPKPKPQPTAEKRIEAAAARTRAAVVESAPSEGSEEEYAADVDAAMGDTPAPAEEMDEEALASVNSDADNSRVNRLNDGDAGLSAQQQGSSKGDIDITRKIRQSVIDNKGLSVYAHNVKIITRDGRVVLKGPVRSEAERRFIENTAVRIAGENNVASGIEITK